MSDLAIDAAQTVKTSAEETKIVDSKEADEEKAIGGKQQKNILKKAGAKLAQPFVDEFHKDYGDDAVATPKSVGDFIFDHAVKLGVAALTIGVTFAAARGKFNGFSKNFSQNLQSSGPIKAAKEAISTVKLNNAKATLDAAAIKNGGKTVEGLAGALGDVADEIAGSAAENKGIVNSVKRIFAGTPKTEFAEGSKLPGLIDKYAGKNADKVKQTLLNAGVGEGADLVDIALAAGAAGAATGGTTKVASGAVDKNDARIGIESKLDTISKGLELIEQIAG